MDGYLIGFIVTKKASVVCAWIPSEVPEDAYIYSYYIVLLHFLVKYGYPNSLFFQCSLPMYLKIRIKCIINPGVNSQKWGGGECQYK